MEAHFVDTQHRHTDERGNRAGSSKPALVAPLIFALLTLLCALFALDVIGLPPVAITEQLDTHGHSFSGKQNPINGKFVGPVQIVFVGGALYEGDFAKHRFNGQGHFSGVTPVETTNETTGETVQTVQHWTLEGTFVEGRLTGTGTYKDLEGSYKGTFENSLPHGQGVYTSAAGWRYEGNFTAGALTGYGTVYLANGDTETGTWRNGILLT
jgi:hypothetical protein